MPLHVLARGCDATTRWADAQTSWRPGAIRTETETALDAETESFPVQPDGIAMMGHRWS